MLKAGGTVEEYEAKADSVKVTLRRELQCFLPACVLTVTVTAGSVILTVVAKDTSGGRNQVESAVVALQSKTLDAMSSVLGVIIEEPPAAPSVVDVEVVVTRFAPSPPPPSPPPTSPPSSPTTLEVLTLGQWALLPLSVLLIAAVAVIVLCYRRHSRLSRNEANLRISRDRANLDLQMLSHQVRKIRVPTELDDLASLPDKRSTAASLPPGPPSSSTGQSVAEQEVTRSGAADNGVAPTAPAPPGEQIILRPTARVLPWAFPGWSGTAGLASAPKKKRPAPADPSAPRTKKEPFTSPCN